MKLQMSFKGSWTLIGPHPTHPEEEMDQWSTLADDAKRHISQRGPQCGVLTMLEKLPDPAARETVERVLADRGLTNPAIAKALRDRLGEDSPSVFTVGNHRRGNCSCAERRS